MENILLLLIIPSCFLSQEERVLFHYNGHGVPKPTVNGEIWVFNKVWHKKEHKENFVF